MQNGIKILSFSRKYYGDSEDVINALKAYEAFGGIIVCSAGNEAVDNDREDNSGVKLLKLQVHVIRNFPCMPIQENKR